MTDRVQVYQTEVPSIKDILSTNRYAYIGSGRTADAILGSTTQLNGFACTPASPTPNLTADIDTGEIYQQAAVDTTEYVALPADPTLIVKQGIFPTKTNFPFPAPLTPGYAIDYLVQIGFLESDINVTSRPYYNTASPPPPAPPLPPINVSNTSKRQDAAIVEVLAGTPAPYPSQVAPAPSPGTIGAWVVTVQYGQTQVISANINIYPGAPFITEKLKDKISEATGDVRYRKLTSYSSKAVTTAPQTIPTNVAAVKINFFSVLTPGFDDLNIWNSIDERFEPPLGRIQIICKGVLEYIPSTSQFAIVLFKNGILHDILFDVNLNGTINPLNHTTSGGGDFYESSGTDYFELYCEQSSGAGADLLTASFSIEFLGT